MQNVELKLELRDPDLARAILRSLGATRAEILEQTDTYYHVPRARLKRRETAGRPAEYIFYDRPDMARARLSRFTIYDEDRARERFGTAPLPVRVVVRKRREVYVAGQVRVHLDDVEGLGRFLEFEAMISPRQTAGAGQSAIADLREALAPALGEPIGVGYADMLAPPRGEHPPA